MSLKILLVAIFTFLNGNLIEAYICTTTGRFGNTYDPTCKSYYLCKNNGGEITSTLYSCPNTFDPNTNECSDNYVCKRDSSNCKASGYFPELSDSSCVKYYNCFNFFGFYIKFSHSCSKGYQFDPMKRLCSSTYKCEDYSFAPKEPKVENFAAHTDILTVQNIPQKEPFGASTPEEFACIEAGLFPDTLDTTCSYYFYCIALPTGQFVKRQYKCPKYFNPNTKECTENYNCQYAEGTEENIITTTEIDIKNDMIEETTPDILSATETNIEDITEEFIENTTENIVSTAKVDIEKDTVEEITLEGIAEATRKPDIVSATVTEMENITDEIIEETSQNVSTTKNDIEEEAIEETTFESIEEDTKKPDQPSTTGTDIVNIADRIEDTAEKAATTTHIDIEKDTFEETTLENIAEDTTSDAISVTETTIEAITEELIEDTEQNATTTIIDVEKDTSEKTESIAEDTKEPDIVSAIETDIENISKEIIENTAEKVATTTKIDIEKDTIKETTESIAENTIKPDIVTATEINIESITEEIIEDNAENVVTTTNIDIEKDTIKETTESIAENTINPDIVSATEINIESITEEIIEDNAENVVTTINIDTEKDAIKETTERIVDNSINPDIVNATETDIENITGRIIEDTTEKIATTTKKGIEKDIIEETTSDSIAEGNKKPYIVSPTENELANITEKTIEDTVENVSTTKIAIEKDTTEETTLESITEDITKTDAISTTQADIENITEEIIEDIGKNVVTTTKIDIEKDTIRETTSESIAEDSRKPDIVSATETDIDNITEKAVEDTAENISTIKIDMDKDMMEETTSAVIAEDTRNPDTIATTETDMENITEEIIEDTALKVTITKVDIEKDNIEETTLESIAEDITKPDAISVTEADIENITEEIIEDTGENVSTTNIEIEKDTIEETTLESITKDITKTDAISTTEADIENITDEIIEDTAGKVTSTKVDIEKDKIEETNLESIAEGITKTDAISTMETDIENITEEIVEGTGENVSTTNIDIEIEETTLESITEDITKTDAISTTETDTENITDEIIEDTAGKVTTTKVDIEKDKIEETTLESIPEDITKTDAISATEADIENTAEEIAEATGENVEDMIEETTLDSIAGDTRKPDTITATDTGIEHIEIRDMEVDETISDDIGIATTTYSPGVEASTKQPFMVLHLNGSTETSYLTMPIIKFVCSTPGRFPDYSDNNCVQYFLCSKLRNGTLIRTSYKCPFGSYFDPEVTTCSKSYQCHEATIEEVTTVMTEIQSTEIHITEVQPISEATTVEENVTLEETTTIFVPETEGTTISATITKQPEEFVCSATGRYPNFSDESCTTYFLCSKRQNGTFVKTLFDCQGSFFDPDMHRCSKDYICPSSMTTQVYPTTISTTTTTTQLEEFVCTAVGRYPNFNDESCATYFLCSKRQNGTFVKTLFNCQGSFFDPDMHRCSKDYICPSSITTQVFPTTISTTTTAIQPEEFVCTAVGRHPNFNDESCATYFLCSKRQNGTFVKTLFNCQGSFFDPDMHRCSKDYVCPSTMTTQTPITTTTIWDFSCSEVGRFKNENDLGCKSYFLCSQFRNGTFVKTQYDCPKMSLFNNIKHMCSDMISCVQQRIRRL